jgi:hypothetical protein
MKGLVRERAEVLAVAAGLGFSEVHIEPGRSPGLHDCLDRLPVSIYRLFGTTFAGDHCIFTDAVATELDVRVLKPRAMPQVTMDRFMRRAKQGHLFSTEVAPPITLTGRIRTFHGPDDLTCLRKAAGENHPWPLEWSLLIGGLLSLEHVGGDRGIGRGACAVTLTGLTARTTDHAEAAEGAAEAGRLARELLRPLIGGSDPHLQAWRFLDGVRAKGGGPEVQRAVALAEEWEGLSTRDDWETLLNEIEQEGKG